MRAGKVFMQRDPRAFLWDAVEAAKDIQAFTQGLNAQQYSENAMVQAAVERKFEIIGEALNQLSKLDPVMAARIPDIAQVVAFRNQLIHGYATVKPLTVWTIIHSSLADLLAVTQALLSELESR